MLKSYSKPLNVGHRYLQDFFNGEPVHIQEKIDGSQISFGKDLKGNLHIRSKNQPIDFDNPGMFAKAVKTVLNIEANLRLGWTYRGEFLQKPKHNTLEYNHVPDGNIILYDIDKDECDYVKPAFLKEEAEFLGLQAVPYFGYVVEKPSLEELDKYLDQESTLGKCSIEGIVLKNYSLFGPDSKVIMAKHVSEKFKEKHSDDWKERNPNRKDVVDKVAAEYGSEARWRKAVQHLKEEGKLDHTPKDIGILLKEIAADFELDNKEEIKEILWEHYKKKFLKGIQKGFPEWYKRHLFND